MRIVCWLLILLTSAVMGQPLSYIRTAPASGHSFGELVLSPAVADNLALLFAKFDTELVLCLEGERRGDDLHVTDFRMPHILMSRTGRVQAASCKSNPRAIGTWHNHPSPKLALVSSSPHDLSRNCYLSRTDIDDFRRRSDALVTVVSCAPHTYAYWRRADVRAADENVAILPPLPAQLVKTDVWQDEHLSELTQARKH